MRVRTPGFVFEVYLSAATTLLDLRVDLSFDFKAVTPIEVTHNAETNTRRMQRLDKWLGAAPRAVKCAALTE
eukprot:8303417-Heterocapsa_arctica.AAC.1